MEATPSEAVVEEPATRLRIGARAFFSDGSVRDVTRLARFASSDEMIARVDATGQARRVSSGEVVIQIGYETAMATTRLAFRNQSSGTFDFDFPSENLVDREIQKKWRLLRIPPSDPADDRTFVRRVHFDLIGLPPSPEELKKYVGDPAPDKRARLIDALLDRPEYVDHWTLKWSDRLGRRIAKCPPHRLSFQPYPFDRHQLRQGHGWPIPLSPL